MRGLFIVLILAGCGSGLTGPNKDYGQDTTGMRTISIRFDTLNPSEDGRCEKSPFQKQILVSERFWKSATEDRRRILILHEMGHCLYNKDHDSERVQEDGDKTLIPRSIMFPSTLSDADFSRHLSYYLSQYFKH